MVESIGFEKFLFQVDTKYLQQLLHQNGIVVEVEMPKCEFDAILGQTRDNEYFILKISFKDFEKALLDIDKDLLEKEIPADYHLREMNNNELPEILEKPDKWSRFDGAAAKILLTEKGMDITNSKVKLLMDERDDQLKATKTIAIQSFVLLCLISIFGWFFPIIGGLMIYELKQKTTDGSDTYIFSTEGRIKGIVIVVIGVASTNWWFWYINKRN